MKTKTRDQDRDEVGWSLMLRRQTDGSVQGQPHTSDAESYELICRVCGDDSRLTYLDVSPDFQRLRAPYPIAEAVEKYEQHVRLHEQV